MLYETSLGDSETVVVDQESCSGDWSDRNYQRGEQNRRRTIAAADCVDKTA